MVENKCENRKPCESCEVSPKCSTVEKKEHEQKRLQEKLYNIRRKVMVMNGKGGVLSKLGR